MGESASAAIDIALDDVRDYLEATGNDHEVEVIIKDTGTDPGISLQKNGDRKYASFNFWGIEQSGGEYAWKSYGYYRNADGQLILY